MFTYTAGNSALDATPYSLTGQGLEKPSYANNRFSVMLGGPLLIPHTFVKLPKTQFTFNFSGNINRAPYTGFGTMPPNSSVPETSRNPTFRGRSRSTTRKPGLRSQVTLFPLRALTRPLLAVEVSAASESGWFG